jgi:F0F1-type ATP synthase delta subunit
MILLNFAHPLTPDHLERIETLTGQKVERVVEVHSQLDPQ